MPRLKGVYRRAWYETHRLFHNTRPVVEALTQANIDVLLLKGAPLVLDYYRNHALRPMSDVDVCIATSRARDAMAIVEQLGWRPTSAPSGDKTAFFHAQQYVHPDGGEIDLHWHVMYESCRPGSDRFFWDHSEPLEFMGVRVRQLGPTMMLLHQVVHGVRWNIESPVRWVPDAMHIMRNRIADIDWPRLCTTAVQLRLTHRLGLGLRYLAREFGAPVPEDVLRTLASTRTSTTERLENSVLLRDTVALQSGVLGNQQVILADFARLVDPESQPIAFVTTFPHYLRYRWGLGGRREIPGLVARALATQVKRFWSGVAANG